MKKWDIALTTADEAPLTAPILLTGTVEENLRQAAALGYQAIEIHLREIDPLDVAAIKNLMTSLSIRISALVSGRLNTEGQCSLLDDVPYVVEAALKGLFRYVDLAHELDTNLVIGWIKGKIPAGKNREKYLARMAGNLALVDHYAASKQVKLFIEVINRYESNVLNSVTETRQFIDDFGLHNCFLHLDSFHMAMEEADMAQAIQEAGRRIGYVHIADNNRRYPGQGSLDFPSVLAALDAVQYKGYLTVECLPWPDRLTAARRALAFLTQDF